MAKTLPLKYVPTDCRALLLEVKLMSEYYMIKVADLYFNPTLPYKNCISFHIAERFSLRKPLGFCYTNST